MLNGVSGAQAAAATPAARPLSSHSNPYFDQARRCCSQVPSGTGELAAPIAII